MKKTGSLTETGCSERGLIFAYKDGSDAGIWKSGEETYVDLENLNRSVQDLINSGKMVPVPE